MIHSLGHSIDRRPRLRRPRKGLSTCVARRRQGRVRTWFIGQLLDEFPSEQDGCLTGANRHDRSRRPGLHEDRLAADAASHRGLRPQLSRPQQPRVCRVDDEPGTGADGHAVRPGRRHPVSRLLLLRGPEQHRLVPRRSPDLARADHDHVGTDFGGDDLRDRLDEPVSAALSARRGGSGLFSRRRVLPRDLVSLGLSHADDRVVHGGGAHLLGRRGPGVRPAPADGRHRRACPGWKWLFLLEGLPVAVLGLVMLEGARRSAGDGDLAVAMPSGRS